MRRVLGLVVLLASSTASAEERSPAGDEAEASSRRWYGYQTLAADAFATVMTGLGVQSLAHEAALSERRPNHATSALLVAGGAATYLFASPTIHALHGHWGKAGASLGLRSAPIALCAGIVGSGGGGGSGADKAAAVGGSVLFVGIVTAMVIDSVVVANESVPSGPGVALAPTFDPKSRAPGLTFAATF